MFFLGAKMVFDVAELLKTFRELSPGEFAGPCPECGGALRLRIWPAKGEYACVSCALKGSLTSTDGPVADAPLDLATATVHIKTARDGRTIHITDHPGEYARLVAEGCIVFDSREIALVRASATTPEQAASYLNIKQTWPGSRIDSLTPLDPAPAESTSVREPGTCYWSKKED